MDWFYSENNQQKGPVSEAALGELASAGVVQDSTLVWHAGMEAWQPYGTVRSGAPPATMAGASFCSECGRQFTSDELVPIGGRTVCAACKQGVLQRIREGGASISGRRYAGFWIRAAAIIIDGIILSTVNVIIALVLFAPLTSSGDPTTALGALGLNMLVSMAFSIIYETWFLTSKGATPGKMVLGLRVIRNSGLPITPGLAIGRIFARMLSQMVLFIGFLMVAWDEEKRSLHDRLCDTRVIKN
jgi:uncharacterized RDD family membrane protein YckC